MERAKLKAELEFMKDLYMHHLPVQEEKQAEVQKYFSRLEELISTTDDVTTIPRDEFPPDDPTTSGHREYKYHSSLEFKKQASRHPPQLRGQDMDSRESQQTDVSTTKDQSTRTQNVEHIPECTDTTSTSDPASSSQSSHQNHNDLPGKLE